MKPLKDIRSRDKEMQLAKSDLTLYTRARNVAPVSGARFTSFVTTSFLKENYTLFYAIIIINKNG